MQQTAYLSERSYGAFPRVLGHYVRDNDLMSLEAAIAKMTTASADALHIVGRGRLIEGAYADIAIFEPKSKPPFPWSAQHTAQLLFSPTLISGDTRYPFSAPTAVNALHSQGSILKNVPPPQQL